MNKALHAFVYLFLIGVGAALWYEFQLNDSRSELRDRNKLLEDYIVKQIVPQVEDGAKYAAEPLPADLEIELDKSDPFDPGITIPQMEEQLGRITRYNHVYENIDNARLVWDSNDRQILRNAFIKDAVTGKNVKDGPSFKTEDSAADKKLQELVNKFKDQNEQFRKTREVIPELREALKDLAVKYNELTPHMRAYVQTNINQAAQISDLNKQKDELEADKVKLQDDIKEQRQKIEGLKLDLDAAKEETDAVRDDLEKQTKMVEALKKQVQTLLAQRNSALTGGNKTAAGEAISSLPFGDKGKIVTVDNEDMFAIVQLEPSAMKELKGEQLDRPLPILELGVKRKGYAGPAGEFVGRIRLRQEIVGKNYILCDILTNWSQDELKAGDVVFAPKD